MILLLGALIGCGFVTSEGYEARLESYDIDGDGVVGVDFGGEDCDDRNATVFPGAAEQCDALDNDCDGEVDEEVGFAVFRDADGDGYGDVDAPALVCPGVEGFVDNARDCDDADPGVNPDGDDVCNDRDDDCDGFIDNGQGSPWWPDLDGDGFGDDHDPQAPVFACTAPVVGWIGSAGDCDDDAEAVFPGAVETCNGVDDDCDGRTDDQDDDVEGRSTWYPDGDGDGVGVDSLAVMACEAPPSHVADGGDCADANAAIPSSDELCNGLDDDCDGQIDEEALDVILFYRDADEDGVGDPADWLTGCVVAPGYVDNDDDCDDTDLSRRPGVEERCDGVDNDCDGLTDDDDDPVDPATWYADADGDGHGDPAASTTACLRPDQHVPEATDCDDGASERAPGVAEVCNGVDDDCDGLTDDVDPDRVGAPVWFADGDGDGFGAGAGVSACAVPADHVDNASDCADDDDAVNPDALESCNNRDDNCDGVVDTDASDRLTWYADVDGDGFGDSATTELACTEPVGFVADATDCDDLLVIVNPAAIEVCDGLDNDCNAIDDDADPAAVEVPTWWRDGDLDGFAGAIASVVQCDAPADHYANPDDCADGEPSVNPAAVEVCDGIDNDCADGPDFNAADAETFLVDADGDGAVEPGASVVACVQPIGTVPAGGFVPEDCDDTDDAVYPGAPVLCDFKDTDCSGTIEEVMVEDGDDLQAAINSTPLGAHVMVCVDDGVYDPITIDGRDIQLISRNGPENTIIDGDGATRLVHIRDTPDTTSIDGFTLQDAQSDRFAGLFIQRSDIVARNLEIRDVRLRNTGGSCLGGAVAAIDSDPLLEHIEVVDNSAICSGSSGVIDGLAFWFRRGTPALRNISIRNNTVSGTTSSGARYQTDGGMIYFGGAKGTVTNFEISHNRIEAFLAAGGQHDTFGAIVNVTRDFTQDGDVAERGGGALLNGTINNNTVISENRVIGLIDFYSSDLFTMYNVDISHNVMDAGSTAHDNAIRTIENTNGDLLVVRYSNIGGNLPRNTVRLPGTGGGLANGVEFDIGEYNNTQVDPMYMDVVAGDYRLDPSSPLRNAGDPRFSDPDGTRSDIGLCGGPSAEGWCFVD